MDRVLVNKQNLLDLLEWRDNHREAVRSLPAPLKAVMIQFTDTDYYIKGLRDGNKLRLCLGTRYERLGYADFEIADGMLRAVKNKLECDEEAVQTVVTVYCSLMALMVYGERPLSGSIGGQRRNGYKRSKGGEKKRNAVNVTYLLSGRGESLEVTRRGSHASPAKAFTVRGHYRHYKSGKVVWIAEYRKGKGKASGKTYRLPPAVGNPEEPR